MSYERVLDNIDANESFDSRDIIERINELESIEFEEVIDEEDQDELDDLRAFREEVEGYCPDFNYGEQFIADWNFEEYAQQLAEDTGMIEPNLSWPLRHIDWEAAANELKQDYTSVDIDGVDYWYR